MLQHTLKKKKTTTITKATLRLYVSFYDDQITLYPKPQTKSTVFYLSRRLGKARGLPSPKWRLCRAIASGTWPPRAHGSELFAPHQQWPLYPLRLSLMTRPVPNSPAPQNPVSPTSHTSQSEGRPWSWCASPWLSRGRVCARWRTPGSLSCATVHSPVSDSLGASLARRRTMLRYCFGSVWFLRKCKGKEKQKKIHSSSLILFAILVSNLGV